MNTINFYTGKNGSGKSRMLFSEYQQNKVNSIAIINTPFSQFQNEKGVLHIGSSSVMDAINISLIDILTSDNIQILSEIGSFLRFLNLDPNISLYVEIDEEENDRYFRAMHSGDYDKYEENEKSFLLIRDFLFLFLGGEKSKSSNLLLNEKVIFPILVDGKIYAKEIVVAYFLNELYRLKEYGVVKSYSFVFHKNNKLLLNQLSSGEQTLLSMYFYILTNVREKKYIFIDEPENSLHPEWQFSISTLINAAIGYRNENVKVYVATHSPLVISGGLNEYKDSCYVHLIEQDEKKEIHFDKNSDIRISVEEILWNAYESIPPANHYLSVKLNDLIYQYIEKEMSEEKVRNQLDAYKNLIMLPKDNNSDRNNKQLKIIELIEEKLFSFEG
ncbi:hypothetical protein B9T11_08800 [Wohlfahrtiimonas chitiniclastica]|uniref:AAA family ATPase n=1 Tax=Wohlfahrtiimonas chitiniclastica TaxID=400946 RepID=UPI000B98A794|nr:AAA family ATPase [Wohlfahrtiimonas chitiniclastica]OYQ79324.1 hypothetical protein B9T11_08800 [Wohlfahrtiimonas chitiniclastica]